MITPLFGPTRSRAPSLSWLALVRWQIWKRVHSHVIRYGFMYDCLLQTTLLGGYPKFGDLNNARKVFNEMERIDLWFGEMGLRANEVTMLGALSVCSQLGAIKEGN